MTKMFVMENEKSWGTTKILTWHLLKIHIKISVIYESLNYHTFLIC